MKKEVKEIKNYIKINDEFNKMIKLKTIKENISQILALTEKNIKLSLRYKLGLVLSYINHIIAIFTPLIIMYNIFDFRVNIGFWTNQNFILYQFIAYNIMLISGIVNTFPSQFLGEKYWKTLPALIIGPFNRFNLLFGIFFSHLAIISFPFILFFILGMIWEPISIITIIFVISIFFLIALIFSGIGLILGVFAISNENVWNVLSFLLLFVFWFSCITYPFEIFPEFIQRIINLNPLYYIFDFLRITWIQDNLIITIENYPFHFIILIGTSIILPLIGVFLFNLVYKKYGITGY
ncbi:MAG: ABC transporter permease [Candidatus Hermodarchaeota archaeon]